VRIRLKLAIDDFLTPVNLFVGELTLHHLAVKRLLSYTQQVKTRTLLINYTEMQHTLTMCHMAHHGIYLGYQLIWTVLIEAVQGIRTIKLACFTDSLMLTCYFLNVVMINTNSEISHYKWITCYKSDHRSVKPKPKSIHRVLNRNILGKSFWWHWLQSILRCSTSYYFANLVYILVFNCTFFRIVKLLYLLCRNWQSLRHLYKTVTYFFMRKWKDDYTNKWWKNKASLYVIDTEDTKMWYVQSKITISHLSLLAMKFAIGPNKDIILILDFCSLIWLGILSCLEAKASPTYYIWA